MSAPGGMKIMKLLTSISIVILLVQAVALAKADDDRAENATAVADVIPEENSEEALDLGNDDEPDDVQDGVDQEGTYEDSSTPEQTVEGILAGGGEATKTSSDEDEDYLVHQVNRIKFQDNEEGKGEDDASDNGIGEEVDDDKGPEAETDDHADAPYKRTQNWKKGWEQHPLYIIILGGFRWDFLGDRYTNLTSFAYLMQHGTTVDRVKPVFPPEDFPVWTSIATGSYPGNHGITGDMMFNLKTRSYFNRSDEISRRQADWWRSTEPFWSTAATHSKKVAFFNWHDCQLPGKALEKPSDCVPYKANARHAPSRQATAAQFDAAFTKIHKDHYDVSVVYTDIVKKAAQRYGPNSPQLLKAMHDVDDILQEKLYDIRNKRQIKDKLNVMVISDYGIADMHAMQEVVLEDYIDLDDAQSIVYSAGYAAITPFALGHNKILLDSRAMPGIDAYLTSQVQNPRIWHGVRVPESLHFGDGEWTTDILLVARPGYRLMSKLTDEAKLINVNGFSDDVLSGGSGYNPNPEVVEYPKLKKGQKLTAEINETIKAFNEFHRFKYDMHTQAFLIGPDFKVNHEINEEIEIVDLYQIFCFLLNIPAGNGHAGSWDRIQDILTISNAPKVATNPGIILSLLLCIITYISSNCQ